MGTVVVRCVDVETAFPDVYSRDFCCDSCHEDAEYFGYDWCEPRPPAKNGGSQRLDRVRVFGQVCCAVRSERWTRDDWARLARAERRRLRIDD